MISEETRSKIKKGSKVTPSILDDLLNIEAVVVIRRQEGICIYDKWVGLIEVDGQLFSGLVSAISAMIGEIAGGKGDVRDRHSFLEFSQAAGDEDLVVWTVLGKRVAIAVILKRKSSKDFRRILASLVYEYESVLEEELVKFTGFLGEIKQKSEELILSRLHFDFLQPIRLITSLDNCPKSCQQVARVIAEEQRPLASSEGIFLRELVSTAVRVLGDVSYKEILQQVIQLFEKKLVGPAEELGKQAKLDLAIEAIDEVLEEDEEITELIHGPPFEAEKVIEPSLDELEVEEPISAPSLKLVQLEEEFERNSDTKDDTQVSIQIEKGIISTEDVLKILEEQKTPDVPIELAKDILKRELTFSGKSGEVFHSEVSQMELNQIKALVSELIILEVSRNALNGPMFDTKKENTILRFSASKIDKTQALLLMANVS